MRSVLFWHESKSVDETRLCNYWITDPLSLYLFILALESLLAGIKQNKDITVIEVEGKEIKCTAFADDLTNFLRDKKSYEALNSLLDTYSDCSGLTVNKEKKKTPTG